MKGLYHLFHFIYSHIFQLILLWPYMWPSGNVALQLNVVVCIICLVAGRVVNLFVPIYYKNIGESLY